MFSVKVFRCEETVCGAIQRRGRGRVALICIASVAVLWLHVMSDPAFAAKSRRGSPQAAGTATAGPSTSSWMTINAATGEVLASQEQDRRGAPASMTKMMLALLVMEAVRDGQLKLTDPVTASALASKMGGSQVYLKQGEVFPVEDMMAALLIGSANDAALALAERLFGTAQGAVTRMNERAAELKLSSTHFASVHGLPPGAGEDGDVTTPRDMARLCQELVKFPDVLRWASTPEAPFRQGTFTLRNSNHLIGHFPGADGLKTGHFHQAGYNVTATATRGNLRLITVVMGAATNRARFEEASRLLGEGFTRYVEVVVAKAGAPQGTEVRLPRATAGFRPVTGKEVRVLVLRDQKDAIQTSVDLQSGLRAPLPKGQSIGTLVARIGDREIARTPLVTPAEVSRSFFWWVMPWR
jgi:serine-type D-Ala-D-Ala carboxypeptidase (penicillin-binding protein 5/6)